MSNLERIINIIQRETRYSQSIMISDSLQSVGIDSLKLVELVISLEDEFDISFDLSDLVPSEFNNVGDLLNLIESYLSKEMK